MDVRKDIATQLKANRNCTGASKCQLTTPTDVVIPCNDTVPEGCRTASFPVNPDTSSSGEIQSATTEAARQVQSACEQGRSSVERGEVFEESVCNKKKAKLLVCPRKGGASGAEKNVEKQDVVTKEVELEGEAGSHDR